MLFALGAIVGGAVGRWPVVLLAVPFAVFIAATTEVEISHVFLGAGYGAFAAAGLALGVMLRRRGVRRAS